MSESNTADNIFVRNLAVPCRIGVPEEERRESQEIVIDVVVFHALSRAGISDDIRETISYTELRRQVTEFVSTGEFRLLEAVAEGVATLALKNKAVRKVKVTVRKKYSESPSIGVEITRVQHG